MSGAKRRPLVLFASVAAVLSLAACTSTPGIAGALQTDKKIAATCPSKASGMDSLIAVDGTVKSMDISSAWRESSKASLRRDTICADGGLVTVVAFSSTRGRLIPIAHASVDLPGSQLNAKLLHVDEKLNPLVHQVDHNWRKAVGAVPAGGSDPVGIFGLLGEQYAASRDTGRSLNALIYTDGLQNVGVKLNRKSLTVDEAKQTAANLSVPSLKGADITIAGIGNTNCKPIKSTVIDALVAFYATLCKRSGATCTVSSELPQ